MSRESFNKFIGVVVLLIILTLVKQWFRLTFALVWLGVLAGYYLPFVDYLFYAYILRPNAEISKTVRSMITFRALISSKKIRGIVAYIESVRGGMEKLVMHTAYFQVIFAVLTFFILSSSGDYFGRGLVYGLSLRILVEQVLQFIKTKEINKWFTELSFSLNADRTKLYLYANGLAILFFSMML